MKQLTVHERFNWFLDTLDYLATLLEIENDEDLEYQVYENLDVDVHTIFHETSHDEFVEQSSETEELKEDIKALRIEFIELVNRRLDADEIRRDPEWAKIVEKAKTIQSNLNDLMNDTFNLFTGSVSHLEMSQMFVKKLREEGPDLLPLLRQYMFPYISRIMEEEIKDMSPFTDMLEKMRPKKKHRRRN